MPRRALLRRPIFPIDRKQPFAVRRQMSRAWRRSTTAANFASPRRWLHLLPGDDPHASPAPGLQPCRSGTTHRTHTARCGRWAAPRSPAPARAAANSITESRVMPSSTFSVTAGVISRPLRSMKRLQVAPSVTWPLSFSRMASSNPLRRASSLASALLA